jgi:hypothetical protein
MSPWPIPPGFDHLLADHLRATGGNPNRGIGASNFPHNQSVLIKCVDGSFAHFHHAFILHDPARKQTAVFTEHCGYHVFPSEGASFTLLLNQM